MAPESMHECLKLAGELRRVGTKQVCDDPEVGGDPDDRLGVDKLQGCATMLHAACEAMKLLKQ